MRVAVVTVACALAVVALGRWERERAVDQERAALLEAFQAVGGHVASRDISAYRLGVGLPDCLVYASGRNPYAISLCFDKRGRLVESVDRRGAEPRYASLVRMPERAPVVVPPVALEALLTRLHRSG